MYYIVNDVKMSETGQTALFISNINEKSAKTLFKITLFYQ